MDDNKFLALTLIKNVVESMATYRVKNTLRGLPLPNLNAEVLPRAASMYMTTSQIHKTGGQGQRGGA